MPGGVTSPGGSAQLREHTESSLHHLTKPLAQTIWCGGRGRCLLVIHHKTGSSVILHCCGVDSQLTHVPTLTALKCHADCFDYIMMTNDLVSWCHDDTLDILERSIKDWPRTILTIHGRQGQAHWPWPVDQASHTRSLFSCQNVEWSVDSFRFWILNMVKSHKNVQSRLES